MNEIHLSALKVQMETALRTLLTESLQNAQNMPEMMHVMVVMSAAGIFCDGMKKDYSKLQQEFLNLNQNIGLTEQEYKKIVDDVTTKVLNEFIELP